MIRERVLTRRCFRKSLERVVGLWTPFNEAYFTRLLKIPEGTLLNN